EITQYRSDPEFEAFLRAKGIPVSALVCSFEPDGRVFDAELMVPGDRALQSWRILRDLVPELPYWPVLFPREGVSQLRYEPLDPASRFVKWMERRHKDPNYLPSVPELTPEVIRADALRNIEAAAGVQPEPWKFRNRNQAFTPSDAGLDTALMT